MNARTLLCCVALAACGDDPAAEQDTSVPDTTTTVLDTSVSETEIAETVNETTDDSDVATCVDGALGCACVAGECDAGLACHDDDLCYACDADVVGCACELEEGCAGDLVCDLDDDDALTCRVELFCDDTIVCLPNQVCDEHLAGEDGECLALCAPGYLWNALTSACDPVPSAHCGEGDEEDAIGDDCEAEHKVCVDASGLEPARCGGCLTGWVADGQTCRAPLDCFDLAQICEDQHRGCIGEVLDPATDAFCAGCDAGYVDDGGAACVPDVNATCSGDGPTSLGPECAAQHRLCVETPGVGAACTDCVDGWFYNPDVEACDTPSTCADLGCDALGRVCVDDGFALCEGCKDGLSPIDPSDLGSQCLESLSCRDIDCGDAFCLEGHNGGDATCVEATCGDSQALIQSSGACKSCSGACNKTGHTGRWWLYTNTSGQCLCETQEGYYLETTLSNLPQPCDADGDGWVRTAAQPYVDFDAEPQIQANARCDLKLIDRVTLQNEWDQRYEVRLCDATSQPVSEGNGCTTLRLVPLYESTELDDHTQPLDTVTFPNYTRGTSTAIGRQLTTAELNPLTKACVSDKGDFNDNGIVDIAEAAEMEIPSGVALTDVQSWMLHFGHFVELYRSYYEDRPGEDGGTLVIAERSRCDGASADQVGFFLAYDEASGSEYWRECTRNRAAAFDRNAPVAGFDFARWSCDASSGGCDMPAPPTTERTGTTVPAHGMCQVLHPPTDGVWRGMSHHSQFRCVEAVGDGEVDEAYEIALGDFFDKGVASGGTYQFNDCGVACPDGDESCALDCIDGDCGGSSEVVKAGAQPRAPILACATDLPADGSVGFAAVRYDDDKDADEYVAGCIDEWSVWPELCPGWIEDLDEDQVQTATGDGVATHFGELACGCGANYGGVACDIGCPEPMIDASYTLSPRSGWWFCGELTTTTMSASDAVWGPAFVGQGDDGDWVLEGEIGVQPRVKTPLCENDDCADGWMVR